MTMFCLASSSNPLTHVVDHIRYTVGGGGAFTTFTIFSNHIVMMIVAALLLILFIPRFLRVPLVEDEVDRLTPRGGRNVIETMCVFLRDFVGRPNLGPYTDRFIPYIWSVFFFILTCNILGLLPFDAVTRPIFGTGIFGTATGNIWVDGTLALCTLFMIVFNGLRLHGFGYVRHFFMGPFPINIAIAFLEVIGLFSKTFALAVRLFANMLAGHILLAVLVGFIFSAGSISAWFGLGVAVPVVLGSVAINFLELFVAFLQAFIFTFLSCVFIGQAVSIHHEHEEEEHAEENAPAH